MKRFQTVRRQSAGFTLVELMIATSVAGVLASVAYPSFSGTLQKVRRSEALVATIQLQQAQERWRSANSRYGTLAEVGVASTAPGRNYVLSVSEPSANGYVALAQATGFQAGDRPCRYMKLSVEAGNTVYSSGETEATTNDAQGNRQCWNQ
jgi:type IV pilus assembly protein PilE